MAVRVVTMCLGTGLRIKLSKMVALSGVTPCCRCLPDVTLLILASFDDCYEYYFDSVIQKTPITILFGLLCTFVSPLHPCYW